MSSEIPQPPAAAKAETTSLGELLGDVTKDVSVLLRQEVELAKAELKQSATRAGKGAGMFAGASEAARFTLLFLSLSLWWALGAHVTGLGWSALIVAVIWGVIAAVLAMRGRKELQAIKGMPQTAQTLTEIPPTFKPSEDIR